MVGQVAPEPAGVDMEQLKLTEKHFVVDHIEAAAQIDQCEETEVAPVHRPPHAV